MSGSARSLSISMFSGLRVASTSFTPEHSKNGKNISAKLVVNAFMNIASKANNGEGRNEAVPFTIWGKLAHICAKSMSPGKEFNCTARLHVYDGRVFVNRQPITDSTGKPITTKKFSYTVEMLTFGEESDKHIANEIQAGVRPAGWNVKGSAEHAQWLEILKARQAIQFDANAPTYGYARILKPTGENIGAYIENSAQPAAVGAPVTFAGVNPAPVTPVQTPAQTPAPATANAQGFVIPGV